jgi:hypothetical protein
MLSLHCAVTCVSSNFVSEIAENHGQGTFNIWKAYIVCSLLDVAHLLTYLFTYLLVLFVPTET